MTAIPTGRLGRTARLLSLPLAATADAAHGVARRLRGVEADSVRTWRRTRNAERTARVLGELKGGPMKVGQLVSTVDALLPLDPDASWQQAVTSLQEGASALPFTAIEPVLAEDLGPAWRRQFRSFDETAVAAASLGQVHRATWEDGRAVAVKVQYPGIADALAGDIAVLSLALRASSLVARGVALPPLVSELRVRLTEELDYRHEATTQSRFAEAYEGDNEVAVPSVVAGGPRVLVTEWLSGQPLAGLGGQPAEVRDAIGLRYQRFFLSSPQRVGLLHTDPHPGNFRRLDDGRLGVLDFGSALALPGGMPATFGRLISALAAEDDSLILRRLRDEGFVRPGRTIDTAKLRDYLAPFTEPAGCEEFSYSRAWLRTQFSRVNDPRNPEFAVALQLNLPAEHLFTHRVWLGLVGVLCRLEATVPVAPELRRSLPGFAL